LSVNTFEARGNALFNQDAIFTGPVFGGTLLTNAPVAFGGPSTPVDVAITGTDNITGTYQSDTLKTGGAEKPVCADSNGTFYLCATPPASSNTNAVRVGLSFTDVGGNYEVGATVSSPVSVPIEVYIDESGPRAPTLPNPVATIIGSVKNAFTADAREAGVCYPPTSTQSIGAVEIYANILKSWNTVPLSSGCTPSNVTVTIDRVNPDADTDGTKLQY